MKHYEYNKLVSCIFRYNNLTYLYSIFKKSCAGPQKPRFIASHSMDMPLCEFIDCFSQFVKDFSRNSSKLHDTKGGGMTSDTPIWIFTFAVNQWESNFEQVHNLSYASRDFIVQLK